MPRLLSRPCIAPREMGAAIPKVIHVTYPRKDALPPQLAENLDYIRATNPDFDLRLYDDADIESYIRAHYCEDIWRVYQLLNPAYGAARADLFRYLCVFNEGGVYMDIKSRPVKPLSTVLRPDDRYLLAQWDSISANGRYADWGRHPALQHVAGGEFQQWHVIGCAGHPFLREVLNRVLGNIISYFPFVRGCGRQAVLCTTGPVAYTLAIAPMRDRFSHRMVSAKADLGLQYSFMDNAQGTTHHQLFARHYSQVFEPLVFHRDLVDAVYSWMQRRRLAIGSWLKQQRFIKALRGA
jgi:inositol phosphorylceramide mannosyltransferase catalytic subunit